MIILSQIQNIVNNKINKYKNLTISTYAGLYIYIIYIFLYLNYYLLFLYIQRPILNYCNNDNPMINLLNIIIGGMDSLEEEKVDSSFNQED